RASWQSSNRCFCCYAIVRTGDLQPQAALFFYPTWFYVHVLPMERCHLLAWRGCIGNQLFGVNPHQYWLSAHDGNFWDSGLQPLSGAFAVLRCIARQHCCQ
ncbi:hypothetical protein, partial [Pseudomonas savastanoi]|uniref:hypothetical protein n=1 Tax=Pseudomonas savastanoi TaxID=29438 RepID=UPI001969CF32